MLLLNDDKHQTVRDSSKKCTDQRGRNSNPHATLPHAAVVFFMHPFNLLMCSWYIQKIHSARGYPMMGAAMLKHHQFVGSLCALYRLVVSSITFVRHLYVGESGAALV